MRRPKHPSCYSKVLARAGLCEWVLTLKNNIKKQLNRFKSRKQQKPSCNYSQGYPWTISNSKQSPRDWASLQNLFNRRQGRVTMKILRKVKLSGKIEIVRSSCRRIHSRLQQQIQSTELTFIRFPFQDLAWMSQRLSAGQTRELRTWLSRGWQLHQVSISLRQALKTCVIHWLEWTKI